ncbi:MAG: hypothetical protein WBF58_10655 [Xanthobacteraceae bacterium]
MRMNRLIASAALVTALASDAAYATTVIIPDPGLSPDYAYFGSGDASVTYDGVIFSTSATLSNGNFYNIGPGYSDGDQPVLSSQQQSFGLANILITLPSPATYFSVNYGTFDGSSVNFDLSSGTVFSQASSGGGTYLVPDVFLVSESSPFTSILVTSSDSVLDVGNVAFGTPLPSTWLMLLNGFIYLGFFVYRGTKIRAALPAA